jgi:hypothetical protein
VIFSHAETRFSGEREQVFANLMAVPVAMVPVFAAEIVGAI